MLDHTCSTQESVRNIFEVKPGPNGQWCNDGVHACGGSKRRAVLPYKGGHGEDMERIRTSRKGRWRSRRGWTKSGMADHWCADLHQNLGPNGTILFSLFFLGSLGRMEGRHGMEEGMIGCWQGLVWQHIWAQWQPWFCPGTTDDELLLSTSRLGPARVVAMGKRTQGMGDGG
jgi:hypothetical protein